jgi:hypothetical protein
VYTYRIPQVGSGHPAPRSGRIWTTSLTSLAPPTATFPGRPRNATTIACPYIEDRTAKHILKKEMSRNRKRQPHSNPGGNDTSWQQAHMRMHTISYQYFNHPYYVININFPRRNNIIEEVVSIVQEHPRLATRLFLGVTPLTMLIECQASASIIETFCFKFPEAPHRATRRPDQEPSYPIESACLVVQVPPAGVIPILLRHFPPTNGPYLSEDQVFNMIYKLLSTKATYEDQCQQLQDLEAMLDAATRAGYLTGCSQSKQRQTQILSWAFNFDVFHNSAIMRLFILRCPNVTEITIRCPKGPDLSSTVAYLLPQLVTLNLQVRLWSDVLSSPLEEETEGRRTEMSSWEDFTQVLGQNNQLQTFHLDFLHDPMTSSTITTMAFQLLTAAVTRLLKHNTIRSLFILNQRSVNNKRADYHKEIFDALKDNTSLQEFNMPCFTDTDQKRKALLKALKDKNKTILEVHGVYGPSASSEGHHALDLSLPPLIQHRCKLNTLGLAMAQDPNTHATKLLSLVENAITSNWGVQIDGDTALGFAYAFLRECPSIWLANV